MPRKKCRKKIFLKIILTVEISMASLKVLQTRWRWNFHGCLASHKSLKAFCTKFFKHFKSLVLKKSCNFYHFFLFIAIKGNNRETLVRSNYTLTQEKKCNYNLCFLKHHIKTTASPSLQPNEPPMWGSCLHGKHWWRREMSVVFSSFSRKEIIDGFCHWK